MAKVKVYNQAGESKEEMELKDAIFSVPVKPAVVYQVFQALLANIREPWAHTKNKGEVRGGGKKPWKQKGTGRARHGSMRSPLWVGGGITFGPRNTRVYKQKVNKKVSALALRMCLSDKLQDNKLIVVEEWPGDGKAKTMATLRQALPGAGRRTLFLFEKTNKNWNQASQNLAKVVRQKAMDANVADLLNNQFVVVSKKAVEVLEKRLAK